MVVKQRRLSANGLIGLRPRAKQRRDASRLHAGSQHSLGCRGGRSGVGRAHSGAGSRLAPGRRRQNVRGRGNVRHKRAPARVANSL